MKRTLALALAAFSASARSLQRLLRMPWAASPTGAAATAQPAAIKPIPANA